MQLEKLRSPKRNQTAMPGGIGQPPANRAEWHAALSQVSFALSLTLIMASALFVTVAINPKNDSYGDTPWFYVAACLLTAPVCRLISIRLDPGRTSERFRQDLVGTHESAPADRGNGDEP